MNRKAVALSLLTAGISGVSIFANGLFVSQTNPLVFAVLRNVAVIVMLTLALSLFGLTKKLPMLSRLQWGKLFLVGAIGGGIPFALFFTGLAQIGALNSNIIQKSLFLWVALLAIPLLKERLNRIQVVGYVSLFVGMFAFSGIGHMDLKAGMWLVLVATLLWAVEHVFVKMKLSDVHPMIIGWGRMLFGLPFLILAVMLTGKSGLLFAPQSYSLTPLLVSAALLTVYVTTWYTAISMAPVTLVSSLLVFAPVVTAVLSSGILGKPLQAPQLGSYIFIALGVGCVAVDELYLKRVRQTV